jgi:hypothetical protein
VLWRIIGPKGDEVAGGWRRWHNEGPQTLYNLPYIIRAIKSRGMTWEGDVAYMGDIRNAYIIFDEKSEETGPHG